ncbi:FadR/GntR family transcriptional regulator [Algicella marina]|uniref:FCD domain-containing protein n=1 Tax=Algicella marina TaxID=2683284 RepID=A0A6P1SZU2_9RHOB|nr:FadR/GntR family transcriptional regulator [Algicella marina]QHQ36194.1 FCD domain-containing protein [Algicella marina]
MAKAKAVVIDSGSVVDDVVDGIRAMINDRKLTVGDNLPTERELCEAFGASRNTVREAMRMLKAYGVVEVRQKVGATIVDNRLSSALQIFSFNVTDVSREAFEDIQGFRFLLEVSPVEQLLDQITAQDIDDLRQANMAMRDAKPFDLASELDFAFHTRLVRILGNKAILDVYQIMKPVILRIIKRGKSLRSFETSTFNEHEAVIDALEARDRLAYQYLLKTHLNAGHTHFASNGGLEELQPSHSDQQEVT